MMEIGNLTFKHFAETDFPFMLSIIEESPRWEKSELKGRKLNEYIQTYNTLQGEWRQWNFNDELVAVTFHIDVSPSNQKPWIGTILVKKEKRLKGIGKEIINHLSQELLKKGKKVLFAGLPADHFEWIDFLSKCFFEQYKIEKDHSGNEYMVMIKPLV